MADKAESRKIAGYICAELEFLTSQAAAHGDAEAFGQLVQAFRSGDAEASVDRFIEFTRRWGVPVPPSALRDAAPQIVVRDHPDDEVWVCPVKPRTCGRIEPAGPGDGPACSLHDQPLRRLRVGS